MEHYNKEKIKSLITDIVIISKEVARTSKELNKKWELRGQWIQELSQLLPAGENSHRKIAKLFKKNGYPLSYISIFYAQKKYGAKK